MSFFAYDWKAFDDIGRNTTKVDCYCIGTKSEPRRISISGFKPYVYVLKDITRKGNTIELVKHLLSKNGTLRLARSPEIRYARSTRSISRTNQYVVVTFHTWKSMREFCSLCKRYGLQTHMDEVDPVVMFLAHNRYEYTGWFTVSNGMLNFNQEAHTISPKIVAFDIECNSSTGGMPKPYILDDRIEMISFVCLSTTTKIVFHLPFDKCSSPPEQTGDIVLVQCSNEMELVEKFFDEIKQHDPDIITGYNIFGFDIQYIVSRLKLFLKPIPDISRYPFTSSESPVQSSDDNVMSSGGGTFVTRIDWTSNAYGRNEFLKIESSGRVFMDMFLVIKRFKLEKYSLDYVSNKFLGSSKNPMPVSEMFHAFSSRDAKSYTKVVEYCVQDSLLVLRLFDRLNMWTDLTETSRVMLCSITDLYTRGEQSKIMNQVVLECLNNNIVMERIDKTLIKSDLEGYKGAHVLSPNKGLIGPCTVLDFQSLYPSIMMAFNICTSSLEYCLGDVRVVKHIDGTCADIVSYAGNQYYRIVYDEEKGLYALFHTRPVGILPGMAKRLIDERQKIKNIMRDDNMSNKITLDRRQNAFKIAANSIYGMTGFENNKYFGNQIVASCVTAIGRSMIAFLSSHIPEKFGLEVVYGDTDSCMILFPRSMDKHDIIDRTENIADYVTSVFPKPITLKFERHCDRILFLTKKRYIMCTNNNDKIFLTYKGVMNARRGYCNYAKNMYNKVLDCIFRDKDPRECILKDVDDLMNGRVDIQDLIITKSIRDLSSYKVVQPHVAMAMRLKSQGIPISGGRLEYVFVVPPIDRTGLVDYVPNKRLTNHAQHMSTPDEVDKNDETIDCLFYLENQVAKQIDDLMDIVGYERFTKQYIIPNLFRRF